MIIVLMGYMASGKSAVGKQLARALNYEFIDLDNYIESAEGSSINEIFSKKGELYFRKAESNYLEEILNEKRNLVLALGGGTPCYGNNINLLKSDKKTISIYLKTSIATLVSRLEKETSKRPLVAHLKTKDELKEYIGKHLFERSDFYLMADHIIETDNRSVVDLTETIIFQLF